MSDAVALPLPDRGECYTYHDGDLNKTWVFAVCLMNEYVEKHADKCFWIHLKRGMKMDPQHISNTRKNKGIEQDRLDRLCEPYISKPLIGCLWTKLGGINIVDGHHRLVKRWDMGLRTFDIYVFHKKMWEQFLLDIPAGKPDINARSGVLEHEKTQRPDT